MSKRGRPKNEDRLASEKCVNDLQSVVVVSPVGVDENMSPFSIETVKFTEDIRIKKLMNSLNDDGTTGLQMMSSVRNIKQEFISIQKTRFELSLRTCAIIFLLAKILHYDYGLKIISDEMNAALTDYFSRDIQASFPNKRLFLVYKRNIMTQLRTFVEGVTIMVSEIRSHYHISMDIFNSHRHFRCPRWRAAKLIPC